MIYVFITSFILFFTATVFSQDHKALTPEQKLNVELMMMGARRQIDMKASAPYLLPSDKIGTTFATKIPFMIEKVTDSSLRHYKKNPDIPETKFVAVDITNHCGGCFRNGKYPPAPYVFYYYPIGAKFKILHFIGTPQGHLLTILSDEKGVLFEISTFELMGAIDGHTLGFQNEELSLLDILNGRSQRVDLKVKIVEFELKQFQQNLGSKDNWDFPPMIETGKPHYPLDDYEGWLKFVVKGIMGKAPDLLKLSNISKIGNYLTADVSIDVNSFVLLIHSKLLSPYVKIQNYGDYIASYRNKFEVHKDFVLGESVKSFMDKLKAKIPPYKGPTMKEREQVIADMLKEIEKKKKP